MSDTASTHEITNDKSIETLPEDEISRDAKQASVTNQRNYTKICISR